MKRKQKSPTETPISSDSAMKQEQPTDDFPDLVDMTERDAGKGFMLIGVHPASSANRAERSSAPHVDAAIETEGVTTETILELGAELGSLTIIGRRTGDDWQFCLALVDQSGLLLDEEEVRRTSDWVDGWPAALRELDELGWVCLTPLVVHEEFRGRILEAVRERLADYPDQDALDRWTIATEKEPDQMTLTKLLSSRKDDDTTAELVRPQRDAGVLLPAGEESRDARDVFALVEQRLVSHLRSVCLWPENERNNSWRVGDYSFYLLSFEPTAGTEVYVQLWSEPDEAGAIFEVVSGARNQAAKEYVNAERQELLRDHGFEIGGNAENFRKIACIESPGDIPSVAREVVAVLCNVMGYDGTVELNYRRVLQTPYVPEYVLHGVSPDTVRKLLAEWGFIAELVSDADPPGVKVRTEHGSFLVSLADEVNDKFQHLELTASCKSKGKNRHVYAHQLSASLPTATAFVDDEGDLLLRTQILLQGGVAAAHLRERFELWRWEMERAMTGVEDQSIH